MRDNGISLWQVLLSMNFDLTGQALLKKDACIQSSFKTVFTHSVLRHAEIKYHSSVRYRNEHNTENLKQTKHSASFPCTLTWPCHQSLLTSHHRINQLTLGSHSYLYPPSGLTFYSLTDLFLTRIQLVLIVYQLLILLLALTLCASHSYFVNQSSNLPLCGSLWKAIFFTLSRLTGSQNNNPVTRMLNFTFLHTSHWALLHSNTMNMFLTTRFLFGPNEHSFWNHSLNKKKNSKTRYFSM